MEENFFLFVFEVINSCGGKLYWFVIFWVLSLLVIFVNFFFGWKLFFCGMNIELIEFILFFIGIIVNCGNIEIIFLREVIVFGMLRLWIFVCYY